MLLIQESHGVNSYLRLSKGMILHCRIYNNIVDLQYHCIDYSQDNPVNPRLFITFGIQSLDRTITFDQLSSPTQEGKQDKELAFKFRL